MIKLSLNLPAKRRIDFTLVKRRGDSEENPLLPKMKDIRRTRSGSKFSRFFRHIFEHKKMKKLLGMNLAVFAIATSFIPASNGFSEEANENFVAKAPIVLNTESGIRYPLDTIRVTQGYKLYHPGVDFDGITGDPVYPILSGKIAGIQYSQYAYGNAVLVDHGNDITSLYAHLSQIFVEKDQVVDIHTVIGAVGETGRAYGDHLHFEIRDHNYPINPFSLLP